MPPRQHSPLALPPDGLRRPDGGRHLDPDDPLVPGWAEFRRARAAYLARHTPHGRQPAGSDAPTPGGDRD